MILDEEKAAASLWRAKDGPITTTAPEPKAVPFKDAPEEKNARIAPAVTTVFSPPEDNAPENIKELRAADDLRKLWNPQKTYESAVTAADFAGVEGVSDQQMETAARRYREIFDDLGLSPSDAKDFVALAKKGPPDEATQAAWLADIAERYDEADATLARQLANRDPRIAAVLRDTRLGNHPAVVAAFIERARLLVANGTLKK